MDGAGGALDGTDGLSDVRIRAVLDNTADAVLTFDEGGAIGSYNPAAEIIFGWTPPEVVGKSIGFIIPELAPVPGQVTAERFMGRRREVAGLHKNGHNFPLELSVSEISLGGERLFMGIAHDITERKAAEEEARNQHEWLTTLINALPEIVCFKDGEGRWLIANSFYLERFGLSGVDYRGKTAGELSQMTSCYDALLLESFETDRRAWESGRPTSFESRVTGADGVESVFDITKLPLFNPDGSRKGLVVVGRDVTESRHSAARIQHLAHYDSLTDLPNRLLFQERLRQALAQARRSGKTLAVIFLDLDKFKDINDTLGHYMGDLLLKAVARRLLRCVRESDTVARLGGDEFAVLLTDLAEPADAAAVAAALNHCVAQPFSLDGHEIVTSTSIGITLFPEDALDDDELLKNADLALYRSKAEGRNNFHFYVAEMNEEVQARKAIECDLRHALGTDQLTLYYQPLVEAGHGRITGCEALLRWYHPERGPVPPSQFIPIAERSELIVPLGRWVLQRACRQGAEWMRLGLPPLRMAVNLSPAQFRHQDLVGLVREVLQESGLPPALLQLEITEGIAMHNVEQTIAVLEELRAMGVSISIDDFGTGYSSLNYLRRFPVDKLKIDRSFITDLGLHPDNEAIVKAIVNLGHGIGTMVNVEGVETAEQLAYLRSYGVDELQGFWFSRPIPPADFARLVSGPLPWDLPAREELGVAV